MDKFYPPNFIGYIPLPDGRPAAGGTLIACRTGTDILAPIYNENGVRIDGSALQIDSHGQARFLIDPSITYRIKIIMPPDDILNPTAVYDNVRVGPGGGGGGMENPMTAKGDIIVGGTDGEAERLGVGANGDILATAPSGSPKWEAGPKKYRNVYSNVPTPNITDGYLGCLFYLSGSAQTLELPSAANIPFKSFIDFVFLDNAATLTITPQGGSVLNAQGSAITIGGQAASMYRLTFLGRSDIGGVPTDQWALGGSVSSGGLLPTCQENFSLLNVTNFYDAGQQTNKLFCSKVVANASATRNKLGFFHKSGDVGKVILGVYDNAGNLLAQTAPFTPDSSTFEQMHWEDTLAPFSLTAGEEYWFAAYFTPDNWSCTINALGQEKSSAFDVNLVGSRSVGVITELPASLGALSYETLVWYESAM